MSKKSQNSDGQFDDTLNDERLQHAHQGKEFKDAVDSNPNKFTSFSEGMPSVDKFEITDASEGSTQLALATDKARSTTESVESALGFLSSTKCRYLLRYQTADYRSAVHSENECESSPSLDKQIALLMAIPWSDKVKVRRSDATQPSEYSFEDDTIILDRLFNDEKLILTFAHQSFHATNKSLVRLYEGNRLELDEFVDVQLWSEVGALVAELNVRKELGLKVAPPRVLCQENSGSLFSINVGDCLESKGMKSLQQILERSMVRGSKAVRLTDIYRSMHDVYTKNFEAEKIKANCYVELCVATGLDRDRI